MNQGRWVWRLVYEDGSTFTSEQGKPNDSPKTGSIFVQQRGVNGADIVGEGAKAIIYREDKGGWMPVYDEFGLMDQLMHFAPVISCVRPGRQMWTPEFKELAIRFNREMRGR